MRDLYGRDINYLRISLTERCNLKCTYCKPENCVSKGDIMAKDEVIAIIEAMAGAGIKKVRFTGGEPLLRKDITEIIQATSNIGGIDDIALTTNGTLLERKIVELKKAGLKRVNISLDTLDEKKYKEVTGGNISAVLGGIEAAKKNGLYPVKLNTVLINEFNNDEIEKFVHMTKDEDIDVRFIELMPMGGAADWNEDKFISSEKVIEMFPDLKASEKDYTSSPSLVYKLPESKGRVGIINPLSANFCSTCNRIRVTSSGKLKLCLHSNEEIDILGALRSGKDISKMLKEYINEKPKAHLLDEKLYIERNMYEIGG